MGYRALFLTGLGLLAAIMPVAAADAGQRGVQLNVSVGTLGIGPELAWRPHEMIGVRANAGWLGIGANRSVNAINYHGRFKLNSFGLLADFYPAGGKLRVTGGVRINKNKVDLTATPLQAITLGATSYTPQQIGTLSGVIEANEITPQLTIGYGGTIWRGLTLGFEAGILYQGKPKVKDYVATGLLASDQTFQANLAIEQKAIEQDVSKYEVFPVVQLALGWAF